MPSAIDSVELDWSVLQPPIHPPLPADEVHLWLASVDHFASQIGALSAGMSSEELKRAELFKLQSDRCRFLIGRGLLRQLMGQYLGVSPESLDLIAGPTGKPALAGPASLQFNLAHSGNSILVAFEGPRADFQFVSLRRNRRRIIGG